MDAAAIRKGMREEVGLAVLNLNVSTRFIHRIESAAEGGEGAPIALVRGLKGELFLASISKG